MSRSGYTDDCDDQWQSIRWRGAVASSIRGKRGQAFLSEALEALDALPEPALIPNDLAAEGSYCMLGAVGRARGTDMSAVASDDQDGVAGLFGIPHALACEIMWENDEGYYVDETPQHRWQRMRGWIVRHLKSTENAPASPTA